MTYRYDEQNKTNTKMCWTEDNRMQAYVQMNEGTDKGRAAYYGYNTTGERYVRYIGTTINITQNGITFHRPILQSPVLYANSLITLNGKGYTKHYFEGDRRVCSKIGGGFTGRTEDDINDRIQPIEGEYDKLFERQYTGIKETFANCIGTDMEFNLKYDPYKTIMENELGRDEAEPAFYYQGDHLGSSAYLTDEAGAITQTLNYLPYGEDWVDVHNNPNYLSRYKYNGKEKDPESGLHYYGARYYDSDISQWLSIDPMADKYPSLSPYNYCADNPVILVDPDGREPILPFVGTASTFRKLLNTSRNKVGLYRGQKAANYLKNLGNTEFSIGQKRPLPTQTGYFNKKKGRYIYTEKGGWIDMVHFLFYAGKAYKNKIEGKKNPVGEAVQSGYLQEWSDRFLAPHSAYSYEDLPSDKFGAKFGAEYFNPKSELTFGEQVENYLNSILKATVPTRAPNYDKLPKVEQNRPTHVNKTTKPIYIIQ